MVFQVSTFFGATEQQQKELRPLSEITTELIVTEVDTDLRIV